MKKIVCLLLVLCFGLVGCSNKDYNVSKVIEGDNITTATITLTETVDNSVIDDEEYLENFIQELIRDIEFSEQAHIMINDIDGTKIGSVLISKGDTISYIFSPSYGDMISGKIEK